MTFFGEETQRSECEVIYIINRRKRYVACGDVVPKVGLEPTRVISSTDFESVTSANSITSAQKTFYHRQNQNARFFYADVISCIESASSAAESSSEGVNRLRLVPESSSYHCTRPAVSLEQKV